MNDTVMQGHGYYNAHSELQASNARAADGILERALSSLTIPREGPITLADFGSSQGRNSMTHMGRALAGLEARVPEGRDFLVIHTDQPRNDFASLFTLLEEDAASYRRGRPNVFSLAVGRSFYGPLLPAKSLTFGWSSIALHWMSHLAAPVPDHIWPTRGTAAVQAATSAVSAADWAAFLTHRARELQSGAQLIVVAGGMTDDGGCGMEPLMDVGNGVLQAMVVEGALPADLYRDMTIPVRQRGRAEWEAPFRAGLLPNLRLEECLIIPTANPILDRWRAGGDVHAFARAQTSFFVAAFGPCLFGADQSLEDDFAARLEGAILAAPERAAVEPIMGVVRVAHL